MKVISSELLLQQADPSCSTCVCSRSISLKLAHEIGYWDTFPDAIGEDMHMFIKAFLRTNGACHLYPIHAPINMCHVQGSNWIKSLWARFLQVREARQQAGAGQHTQQATITGAVLAALHTWQQHAHGGTVLLASWKWPGEHPAESICCLSPVLPVLSSPPPG